MKSAMPSTRADPSCPTKRRTGTDVEAIRSAINDILNADHPQTVIEKTEKEYKQTVIRLLKDMRLSGEIHFDWIIDSSRITHETQTFDNLKDAVEQTAKYYRRSAMRESSSYIEIWCEKAALAGIIWDVAGVYDVPVIVSKGVPSLSQLYVSFKNIYRASDAGKECFLYQFGDHDPTGALVPEVIRDRMQWFCERWDCTPPNVERFAITEEQIAEHNLPTRPTKRDGNTHANKFEGDSVELDALPSAVLRDLVRDCIEQHITPQQLGALREAEESEPETLVQWGREIPSPDFLTE
jgi:hypothetical protein